MAYTGSNLMKMTAGEVLNLLKTKKLTPSEAITESVRRIKQVDGNINACVTLSEEEARKSVISLEKKLKKHGKNPGWLAGMPILIKDLNATKNIRTTFGSMGYKDYIPSESEPIIDLMELRGAIVLGKTNTPEMGAGGNTFNDVFGYTRNPWDTRKNAGGSSGGAAAALASGQIWLAQGSDLAGSLRTPAAYCGVIGFRPSPGRSGNSSDTSMFAFESVDGPMARNVADTALLLDNMTGFDDRMPITFDAPRVSFQRALERAKAPKLIAYSATLNGFAECEPEIDAIMQNALKKLQPKVKIEEACPQLPHLYETYITLRGVIWASGCGRLPADKQKFFKKTLFENIQVGINATSAQIIDANLNRSVIYMNMRNFLQKYDVLACPVVGLDAQNVENEYPTHVNGVKLTSYVDWLKFSFLSTTTSLPSVSVPVGFTKSGVPVGIQLIGRPRGEAHLLGVAQYLEQSVGLFGMPIDPNIKH